MVQNSSSTSSLLCESKMISIGICAYNEEANIGLLLGWLTKNYSKEEIIVVASGCTDNTVGISQSYSGVNTIVQKKREGKASAINLFLEKAHGEVIVLVSADTVPDVYCVERLRYMLNGDIGIVGCRVKPIGGIPASRVIWRICHELSKRHPKIGEIICFRNIVKGINSNTSVDEVAIEAEVVKQGYRIAYAPEAVIWNKACDTYKDLLRQRKRNYRGHLQMAQSGYSAASMSLLSVIMAASKCLQKGLLGAIIIESYARLTSYIEFKRGIKENAVWEHCSTTKTLV